MPNLREFWPSGAGSSGQCNVIAASRLCLFAAMKRCERLATTCGRGQVLQPFPWL
jgi:hypothetical protein